MKLALALFTALVLAACSSGGPQAWTIEGRAYEFPAEDIVSTSRGPPPFVRLSPPDTSFHLVHDGRLSTDAGGGDIIFSITAGDVRGEAYLPEGHRGVVCRRANFRNVCGFAVDHGGTHWSVVFPAGLLDEAHSIRDQAVAQLDAYAR
jgi:hypothetical protein